MNNVNQNIIEEDEIDLKELLKTILKYKYKILIFTILVVFGTLLYVLSLPNSYKTEIILAPQVDNKSASGGLAGLASLAGVNLGSGGTSKDPLVMMQTTLKDYEFNKMVIEKYNLAQRVEEPQNLVFAMGLDWFYNYPKKSDSAKQSDSQEERVYKTNEVLQKKITISSEKASGLITLSVENIDRFFAKDLADIYLKEMIEKIKFQDMKEIDKQIEYYTKELTSTHDVSLKEQLSKSLSTLMQKRVFSLANDYYFVSKVTDSRVAYIKEKTNPKRALMLVVSFVTSLILGIFMAFFLEFIRSNKNDNKK